MLCSWGRFLVVLFGSLALSIGATAATPQHPSDSDRSTLRFLGIEIVSPLLEAESQFEDLLPNPFDPPGCEFDTPLDFLPTAEFEVDSSIDVLQLDPIQAIPMPIDQEMAKLYQDQIDAMNSPQPVAIGRPFQEDTVRFPNNGCYYENAQNGDSPFSDSEPWWQEECPSEYPSEWQDEWPGCFPRQPEPFDLHAISVVRTIQEISQSLIERIGWGRRPSLIGPYEEMASDLIVSGLVPPAPIDPAWDLSPILLGSLDPDLADPAPAQPALAPERTSATERPIDPAPLAKPTLQDREQPTETPADVPAEAAGLRKSFSELFRQASAKNTLAAGDLRDEATLPSLPTPNAGPGQPTRTVQQLVPSISLSPASGSSRPITLVFQFNQVNHHSTKIERQLSNDRIVGSGVSSAYRLAENENELDEAEIFDRQELDAYWEHYTLLAEMGITFPLAENLRSSSERRLLPAQTASAARVTRDSQFDSSQMLTWEEIKQIPPYSHMLYRDFCDSTFFSDPGLWLLETCYRIECELCGSNLLAVWNYILDSIDRGRRKMQLNMEIEAQQKEAQRLRYLASQIERMSSLLDSGARHLTFWALEHEGTASAQLSTEVENR